MKVRVLANELLDSDISFVSLVKNGAIRSPFKILKNDEEMEMTRHRNARREQQLAARQNPVRRNTFAELRKASQRAADVGCAFLKDTDEMDPQPGRYGADPLQANRDEERGAAENHSLHERLAEIQALLRAIGQALAATTLGSEIAKLETAQARLEKAEAGLMFKLSNAFRGGDLDWLERQGEEMVNRNAALMADARLNRLDESLAPSRNVGGIEKADGDRVLGSAYDSGLGVTGKY